jgi:hypothetical protein
LAIGWLKQFSPFRAFYSMNNFFRTIIAGYGAKKLGGGCFSTIIIFVIIYMLLGKCGNEAKSATLPVQHKVAVSSPVR